MHVFTFSLRFCYNVCMDALRYVWCVFILLCCCCCFFFQGFLAKDLQAEALNKLDHRVKVAAEQFMKILEEIDALVNILVQLDCNCNGALSSKQVTLHPGVV